MKTNLLGISLPILLLLLLTFLPACSDSTSDAPRTETVVNFSVITSAEHPLARATPPVPDPDGTIIWDDRYISEEGTALDNLLLRDGFTVLFSDKDCSTILSRIEISVRGILSSADGSVIYNFTGVIPSGDVAELKKHDKAKIHVIANAGEITSLNPQLSFSRAAQTLTTIPMWGVQSIDLTGLQEGLTYQVKEPVSLLRAMAKVEIEIAPSTTEYPNRISALVSAEIRNANRDGYVLPYEWNTVNATGEIRFDNTLNPLPSRSGDNDVISVLPDDDSAHIITFYLPETEHTRYAGENAAITLKYIVNGQTLQHEILFADYEDGIPGQGNHIVRNHLYNFAVKQRGTDMQVSYTVCPLDPLQTDIPDFN